MRLQVKVVTEVWVDGEVVLTTHLPYLQSQDYHLWVQQCSLAQAPSWAAALQVLENMPSLGRFMCKQGALKHKPHVITVNLPPYKARVFKIAGYIQGTADCLVWPVEC